MYVVVLLFQGRNVNPLRKLTADELAEMNRIRWWHRIPIGLDADGKTVYTPGQCLHGIDGTDFYTQIFGLPRDLTGRRVLDVGGWDGLFAFEAARRGAVHVTVADIWGMPGGNWGGMAGFDFAKRILGAEQVVPNVCSVYDLTKRLAGGGYDVVLCYGILYHLVHPTVAMEQIADMTKRGGLMLYETAGNPYHPAAVWELHAGAHNDGTNLFYPSFRLMQQLLTYCFGCMDVRLVHAHPQHWDAPTMRYTVSATRAVCKARRDCDL